METPVIGYYQRRVENRTAKCPIKKYLDSFKFDCMVRNLTPKTIEGYFERLGYLLEYLADSAVVFESLGKPEILEYVHSMQGQVSDETINGRIRVYRRFRNHLIEEDLRQGDNPMAGVKLLKTAKRIKAVITPEEIQKIIASIDRKRFEGQRNLVMILLFWAGPPF